MNVKRRPPLNTIVTGDCIEGMRTLPSGCASLVLADPPYGLDKDFGPYRERDNHDRWLPWSKEWIDESVRLLRSDGSIFIYGIHHKLCWLQCYLYDIGLKYRRQIIWHYENGFAGYTKTLAAHYEPVLWFSKSNEFTYLPIREPYKSKERLKYKITKNGKEWQPHPEGRLAGDVWRFPTLAGRRFSKEKVDHPTQKPLPLSLRIVSHFSRPGELVVVPFAGSGSECLAAAMARRHFIGFELNADYVTIADKRLKEWRERPEQLTLGSPASTRARSRA